MIVKDFVIIGGGIAGFSALKAIREENTSGSILWISDEDRIPYKRTKINKSIATGFSKDQFALIDHDWLVDNHIELLFDRVENIYTDKKELTFQHRGHLKYDKLIIAVGNKPNPLDLGDLPKDLIYHVYTARQAENIIRAATKNKKYLVIGAGVEGVETADQLIQMGKEVVLIDKSSVVLSRFFTNKFSTLMQESILKTGIKLILDVNKVVYSETESEKVCAKINGEEYEFDAIISTIGYTPNITLALNSDIDCNIGILVDEYLQTSVKDVYAAGDVAEHPNGIITSLWHAAEHQGMVAGKNVCGKSTKLEIKPFRMKTEVFNEFYFSVFPHDDNLELVEETNDNIVRDMYFKNGKLNALLMKNDGDKSKIYQQALMEEWDLEKIKKELPLE